ncbi:MAG: type III-A CRISPR-associated RAMP protein Csm5 [Streptococcus sp.]|nr:type III-A CRISPR-associated RAMP protein Csm5 [Streptococcus sp.]
MKNEYRVFKLTLRTLAPVHIGSGKEYTSREFIYENNCFYFPDMGKLYAYMLETKFDKKFEEFLQNKAIRSTNNRLISFLQGNNIKNREFGGYKIKESGFESDKLPKGNLGVVLQFMRDGFGLPYIPGSSLKGAIRTILMNSNPKWSNKTFFKKVQNPRIGYIENKDIIPWGASKEKDIPFDDIFNAIHVSDSSIIDESNLVLVQKWDLSSKENSIPKALPVYRESLAPMTVIDFTITTTTKFAGELIEGLGNDAQSFYKDFKNFFLSEFPNQYIQNNIQYPIYLGAGSGAWTKTIFKQANGKLQKQYKNSRTKMVRKGTLKLTKFHNKKYRTKRGNQGVN